MSYIYLFLEPHLYTVGFYDPTGTFQPESDWATPDKAARRVNYLNGGSNYLKTDVCLAGAPAVNGICGDPGCVCADK